MYRILTFDGGGVLATLSAQLLNRIFSEESLRPNLIAGASAGSIIYCPGRSVCRCWI